MYNSESQFYYTAYMCIISWHVPWREERSESVQKVVFVGMLERGEQQSNVRWQGGRQPGQAVCPMSRTKLVETVQ